MGLRTVRSSISSLCVIGVGFAVSLGGCSKTGNANNGMNGAIGASGSVAIGNGTAGALAPAATGGSTSAPAQSGTGGVKSSTGGAPANVGTGGASATSTAGMGGSAPSMAGASSAAGSSAAGSGTAGAPPPPVDKIHCTAGTAESFKLCDVITKANGGDVQLGPYGAQEDQNLGSGANGSDDSGFCAGFVAGFGEDPKLNAQLQDIKTTMLNFDKYTIYRPGRWQEGEKFPLITWGNGTCAQPEGYGVLLRYIASYGFIVVAANNREVGDGAPLTHGIDVMLAANKDASSPYYNRIDDTKIGVAGHSQGAGAAVAAAQSDKRIKASIFFNGGGTASGSQPFLSVSAEMDIGDSGPGIFSTTVNAASKAAFLYFHHPAGMGGLKGHLTLMLEPERIDDASVNWFKMILNGDATAKMAFVGASCGLCGHTADYDYGEHGLD